MKVRKAFFATSLLIATASAQSVTLVDLADVPAVLEETSGIEVNSPVRIWSQNDSGGEAALYGFDASGALFETLRIVGATNRDWEDLAQDALGNFYIADCGNNAHNRLDLKIYKIPNPDSLAADSAVAGAINFSYPDQTEFPPPDERKNFDCEAVVAIGDSLHLFSKNWTSPFTRYTKHYTLPNVPGTYIAHLCDSFDTDEWTSTQGQITSADISPDGEVLALMSYRKLWLFSNFIGTDFFSGDVLKLDIPTITQIEAICFISETEVYITDEVIYVGPLAFGGNLYYVDLGAYLGAPEYAMSRPSVLRIAAYPNPFNGDCRLQIDDCRMGLDAIEVFDINGRMVDVIARRAEPDVAISLNQGDCRALRARNDGSNFIWQPDVSLTSGVYFVRAKSGDEAATKPVFYMK